MKRTTAVYALALLAVGGGVLPAQAGTAKPTHGSYSVTLLPDPTPNATNTAGKPGCSGVSPAAIDKHALTVPRKGTLKVVLDSPDPTGQGKTDWDLYVETPAGEIIDGSHGGTSHEETATKFKSGQPVQIVVCNLAGEPTGNVTYDFS
jgi:hypothetical protein